MASVRDFRDLVAWQRAVGLKRLAYELCARLAARTDFKFCAQVRDAAASGPRNIAEGFGRHRHREFANFVRIAKASEVEVLNHFLDAEDRGYLSSAERATYEHCARRAIKAAVGLLRYLESSPDP